MSIVAHKRSICRTYFTRQDRRDIVQNAQDAVLLCLTYEQLLKDMEEITTCFFFSLITIAEYYVVGNGHGLTRKRGGSSLEKTKRCSPDQVLEKADPRSLENYSWFLLTLLPFSSSVEVGLRQKGCFLD